MSKYKEIFKLKKMLEKEGIPFEFINRFETMVPEDRIATMRKLLPDFEQYQICYPSSDNRWISVVEGLGTYGSDKDLLEIMGGNKPYDTFVYGEDHVQGYMTARAVFNRIKKHYEGEIKR